MVNRCQGAPGGRFGQLALDQGDVEIKVRGTTSVYNNRNGVFIDGQGHANIDFGRNVGHPSGIGNNAFTMNAVVAPNPTPGVSGPRNFRNSAAAGVMARHNQWQRCGTGATCGSIANDVLGTITSDPPQPQRSIDLNLYPLQISAVSPMRVRPGQLLRIFGSGFNAIDGYPVGGDCDTGAVIAIRSRRVFLPKM